MKTTTWIILIQLFIIDIYCNDAILSKFHQTGFKLRDDRMELIRYSQEYYNFFEVKTYKYNRTTPATNITFNMKVTVKDQAEVLAQVYKFLSNEYRHFPIRFQVNLKKSFEANVMGLKSRLNCGNMSSFYFEKDIIYHACNFVIDETRFPPLIPNGRFRIDITFLYLNKEMALLSVFAEVYTPIEYPKN